MFLLQLPVKWIQNDFWGLNSVLPHCCVYKSKLFIVLRYCHACRMCAAYLKVKLLYWGETVCIGLCALNSVNQQCGIVHVTQFSWKKARQALSSFSDMRMKTGKQTQIGNLFVLQVQNNVKCFHWFQKGCSKLKMWIIHHCSSPPYI